MPSQESPQWTKGSKGELLGSFWSSKGVDITTNPGKVRLSERLYRVFDSDDDADMEVPVAFIRTNADTTDRYWVLTQASASSASDGLMFKTTDTSPIGTWAQDAIASTPTDCFDNMEIFGQASSYDRLIVARDTDLALMNNGAWTASWWVTTLSQSALSASNPHFIHNFLNLLLVPDGNVVHTVDDSLVVVASRITLPKEYQIIWVKNDGYRVYFGTRNLKGGDGLVFPWNGTDQTYEKPMRSGGYTSMAGTPDENGIMTIVNDKGQILKANGDDFTQAAAFPCFQSKLRWNDSLADRDQMIHPNGMRLIEGQLHFLVNSMMGGSNEVLLSRFHSGVWVLDKDAGLYLKYPVSSYDGATDNSWGDYMIEFAGALFETTRDQGRFLVGMQSEKADLVSLRSILLSQVETTASQHGYFITPQIQSDDVQAFWKRFKLAFKELENSTDRIIVKYRVSKDKNFFEEGETNHANQETIEWDASASNTFTVTAAGSPGMANAAVGMEVEILRGRGSGGLAHILTIALAGGTYTVTLDEDIPNAAGGATALATIQNWTKLGTISSQTIDKKLFSIAKRSPWIQFKVELRGTETSPEIQKLLIEYNTSKR